MNIHKFLKEEKFIKFWFYFSLFYWIVSGFVIVSLFVCLSIKNLQDKRNSWNHLKATIKCMETAGLIGKYPKATNIVFNRNFFRGSISYFAN